MLIYNQTLSKKSASLLATIIFALLTVIITILFNFKGIFKVTTAKGVSISSLKEISQKQIGYVSRVYEENGKRYLTFDDVKFLTGKEAVEAAKKDNNAILENGQYYVMDDYYIVNEDKKVKNYAIDSNASLNLLGFMVGSDGNDISNRKVDYEKFKAAVNNKNYPKLCYIDIMDNVVTKVEGQYVP